MNAAPCINDSELDAPAGVTGTASIPEAAVGILHSLTGSMCASEKPLVEASLMALEEINAAGGVLGHRIRAIVEDGASEPEKFAAMARKLVQQHHAVTLFGCWTSASRKAVKSVIEALDSLLWYPVQYEGLEESPHIIYTGSCLNQQIEPAVRWFLAQGKRRCLLVGSDYVFPRTANRLIASLVKSRGGSVTEDLYFPLGWTDFSDLAERIPALAPEIIFNTLNGDSNFAFFRQLYAAGLRADAVPVLSFSIAEGEHALITHEARGHYTCWSYFQTLATPENRVFVRRYQRRCGQDSPTSDPIVAAYGQPFLWKQAVEAARSFKPADVRKSLVGCRYQGPGGVMEIQQNHHLKKSAFIGRARDDGLFDVIWQSDGQIKPKPWLGVEDVGLAGGELIKEALGQFPQVIYYANQLETEMAQRKEAEARLHAIIDASPVPELLYDDHGCITYLNTAFIRTFGYTLEDIRTLNDWWLSAYPDSAYREWVKATGKERLARSEQDQAPYEPTEVLIHCRNGDVRTVLVQVASADHRDAHDTRLVVFYDVTEQKRAAAAVRRQKEYLQAIFEAEPECVKVVALDGLLEDMNPAGLRMLEVSSLQEAKKLIEFVDPEYRDAFLSFHKRVCGGEADVLEFPITGAKGTRRWLETHATPLHDENGAVISLLGVTRDITERRALEETIRQMAFYDPLTNLPNYRLLEDRLDHSIARARRNHLKMSLLFIDLDKFKQVNDEMGHAAGDWLLQRAAARMQECLRASDTAARIGGDEFVVLLPDAGVVQDAINVAEKIRATLEQPFITEDGKALRISSSIGVVIYPDHADTPRDLLRFGDEAMYRAKKSGRNAVEIFGPVKLPTSSEISSVIQLVWKSSFVCGEPTIDREHQELFRLANTLLELATRQEVNPEEFNQGLDALLSHVTEHFSHEEAILRGCNYAGLGEHAERHRSLLKQATKLRRQNEKSGLPLARLIEFLASKVVAGHMLREDKKFYGLFADSKHPEAKQRTDFSVSACQVCSKEEVDNRRMNGWSSGKAVSDQQTPSAGRG